MASHPPSGCCAIGNLHEGSPSGKLVKIAGKYDGYLAEPVPARKREAVAIVYLPDIMGLWQNSLLMADQFAAKGYLTLVVDIYNGDPVPLNPPPDFNILTWLKEGGNGSTPHSPETIDPVVRAAITHLRLDHGVKSLGAVGYCLGAKYLVRHYTHGIDVGYIAHPSFVNEAELAAISGPLSIAAAEHDHIFTPALRQKSEEILAKCHQPYQITLHSHVEHGFAVRCDLSQEIQRFAKEQAFSQAVEWFHHYLR
ncbi:hypothetical protein LCI18_013443 [Fusarium solani-melongenae]|uniref:Uncharacterized protein n=1 Tax=Fusarium solani subsp. cucurbitae TaxID=2747967 RepID=A0ACD3ZN55_FUSSC|nr:hypothetical protein LCI18_013443 [Fusarium solani-melongenae]